MIGGNQTIQLQISTVTKNALGEPVVYWTTIQNIKGWIDLSSGDSKHTTYNAKIQESTHVFVADYVAIDSRIKSEICRLVDESYGSSPGGHWGQVIPYKDLTELFSTYSSDLYAQLQGFMNFMENNDDASRAVLSYINYVKSIKLTFLFDCCVN